MTTTYDEMGNVISTDPQDVQLTDSGASPFSLQYYRDKVLNFQAALNAMDIAIDSAWDMVAAGANDEITQDIYTWLGDVESKKTEIKVAAASINAGANALRAVSIEFPSVNIPQNLGAWFLPIGVVGTIAAIAGITTSIIAAINALRDIYNRANALESLPPEQRATLAQSMLKADQAAMLANGSVSGNVATAVKWVAIGVLAYLAFQAFETHTKRGK